MTCIAAIIDQGNITMMGDSACLYEGSGKILIRKDRKVFLNGPFLIGGTGGFRFLQLLKTHKFGDRDPLSNQSDLEYMITYWIDELISICEGNKILKTESGVAELPCALLVGYNGQLYEVDNDFDVGQVYHDYASVGSGSRYALGSLRVTEKMDMKITDRLKLALETAAYFDPYVREPFYHEFIYKKDYV